LAVNWLVRMSKLERAIILVKAWPQPSIKYGETVCCAGVTPEGRWRRLFPIRFRHLSGDAQFRRWDVVEYRGETPRDDRRIESCRVDEPTLRVVGKIPERERAAFLDRFVRPSCTAAQEQGESLTLVRPRALEFKWKRKTEDQILSEFSRRAATLTQGSLLDKDLATLEPCPYDMSVVFVDEAGRHRMACSDWETAAAFYNLRNQYGDEGALNHLRSTYEGRYMSAGLALALGTVKKRPKQWLLLGMLRLDVAPQASLL
jgi:hypothetical protein